MEIEVGGISPGTQHDQVQVAGNVSLNGTLAVSLINSFSPVVGNSFDILNWTTVAGTFSLLDLQPLAGGLAWNTSQLYTSGVLSVGIAGDYNGNGSVDTADYILWRNGGPLANQVDDPNTVNGQDYTEWRARFGNPGSGSGSSSAFPPPPSALNASVPEPTSLALFLIAAFGLRIVSRDRGAAKNRC